MIHLKVTKALGDEQSDILTIVVFKGRVLFEGCDPSTAGAKSSYWGAKVTTGMVSGMIDFRCAVQSVSPVWEV